MATMSSRVLYSCGAALKKFVKVQGFGTTSRAQLPSGFKCSRLTMSTRVSDWGVMVDGDTWARAWSSDKLTHGFACRRSRIEYMTFATKARASSANGDSASASLADTTERGSAKKTKKPEAPKKKTKDADMPKRPPSAYFIFMETFRKQFKEENPDVKGVTASAKAGGERWLQLTEEEKAPYIAEVVVRKAQYEKAMAAYKNSKGLENGLQV
jgi:hypothetical protein